MIVRKVDDHVYPSPVIEGPCLVCVISPLFQKSFRNLIVNVMLLHDLLVVKGDVRVQVLETNCLTES